MEKETVLTWRDLRDATLTMEEKHLDKPVTVWGDEKGFTGKSIDRLDEDYLFDGEEGCAARSHLSETLEDNAELPENERTDHYVVHEQGTPILWVE